MSSRGNAPLGYIEAKDIGEDLRRAERTEQLKRMREIDETIPGA